jgi:hypothetical protein
MSYKVDSGLRQVAFTTARAGGFDGLHFHLHVVLIAMGRKVIITHPVYFLYRISKEIYRVVHE